MRVALIIVNCTLASLLMINIGINALTFKGAASGWALFFYFIMVSNFQWNTAVLIKELKTISNKVIIGLLLFPSFTFLLSAPSLTIMSLIVGATIAFLGLKYPSQKAVPMGFYWFLFLINMMGVWCYTWI